MPGVASQPSLLVKKADGTSVRMSWDEFKAYQENIKTLKHENIKTEEPVTERQVSITEPQTVKENLPMKEPEVVLPATTAPVKEVFVDEAKASESRKSIKFIKSVKSDSSQQITDSKKVEDLRLKTNNTKDEPKKEQPRNWERVDNKPLLNEEVVGARKQEVVRTTLPDDRGDVFDQVIRNLKFPVRDELRPRLKSLIVSRVKDIRSDEQVGEYAMRPVERGGLGMTETQVGELLRLVNMKTLKHENIKTQNPNNTTQITNSKSQVPNYQPSTRVQAEGLPATNYQLSNSGEKPVLHDVVATAPQPMAEKKVGVGPMEEFSTFEIKDFSRLGQPGQASEVLIKKFETMRAESLILYLRAVKAWQKSPLYRQYQQVIVNAINQGRPTKETVATVGLKLEEFEAITKVCSNL